MRDINNRVMRVMRLHAMLFSVVVTAGVITAAACKGSKAETSASTQNDPNLPRAPKTAEDKGPHPIETVREKMEQDKAERAAEAASANGGVGSGSGSDASADSSDYVPAEFKSGMARWKDVGVYLDGQPISFLNFGELPITLKPTWVKDKVSAEKPPGSGPEFPGWKWSRQRFYKFTDYLKALHVDISKIKEIHVYGSKLSETIIATGKDLQSKAADNFMFRFGGNTSGKPIPHSLSDFGNGKSPDKIAGVMIYMTKKPPTLVRNEGLFLDGVKQEGVPYYGEPLRGGVRVYVDDRLATIIKRQDLDVKKATKGTDGELHWKLIDLLKAQGADLSKAQEMWTVRDDLRQDKPIPADHFANLEFSASSQAKGGILVYDGDQKVRANVLAFHSRHIDQSEIPVPTPDDQ